MVPIVSNHLFIDCLLKYDFVLLFADCYIIIWRIKKHSVFNYLNSYSPFTSEDTGSNFKRLWHIRKRQKSLLDSFLANFEI